MFVSIHRSEWIEVRHKRATMTPVSQFRFSDIENDAIVYRPRNASHKSSTDNITYTLRADNAQPASASLSIDISAAEATTPAVSLLSTVPPVKGAPTQDGYDHPTPKPIPDKTVTKGEMPELSNAHLIVIIIVCVVTGLSIFFFIAVKCYKARHKHLDDEEEEDGYSTSSQGSSKGGVPYDDSDSEVYTSSNDHLDPHRDEHMRMHGNEPQYPYSKSIPTINVTSGTPDTSREHMRPRGHGSRSSLPGTEQHPRHYGEDYSTLGSKLSTSTETSKTVPTCKVTPLGDAGGPQSSGSSTGPPPGSRGPDSGDERAGFNWEQVDPELLDHCRRTNPVLHKNKYWV